MSDDLPETKRPPAAERLADALEAIADILADISRENAQGLDRIEKSMIQAVGSVRELQERDYLRVTRLDEAQQLQLRSIDTGIAKILKLLGPLPERVDNMNERILAVERKTSNGSGASHQ